MIVLDAWLKFRGLRVCFHSSRDGCCSLLIQSGVPSVQSSFFVLKGQSPIALGPAGTRQERWFLLLPFQVLSVRIVTKAYFPSAFYHCHLKSVLWLTQCDPSCPFSEFLPLFSGTQKHICATELMATSPRLNLVHGGNWTTGLMRCPGLHAV